MVQSGQPGAEAVDRRSPVHHAIYGTSRVLGDVEFLTAQFGSHRFAPHSHPVFALGCVERGACRIWHRGMAHVAQPGDVIMINPHEPHSAEPVTDGGWDYAAKYVSAESAARWLPDRFIDHGELRLQGVVHHAPQFATDLSALCRTLGRDPESPTAVAAFAHLIDGLFVAFGQCRPAPVEAAPGDRSARVRQYLDEHFASPVRIEALARLVGLSPFRLIREFTRVVGMPPYTYLLHVRVAKARAMLKAGMPITETAMSVGFSDQSHLTRFFRRITGVPPGLYARGMAEGSSGRRSAS
jgi:AraC-like DNA-binding protein